MKENFISVKDKKLRNWSMYYKYVYMLTINFFTENSAGYITSWVLKSVEEEYTGSSVEDFIDTLNTLKEKHNVETRNTSSKDIIIIYIDNIEKIRGFFSKYITMYHPKMIQLEDNFEFREYKEFIDQEDVVAMQNIVNNVFIPDKYFYITPNQMTRKRIAKACDSDLYKEISPKNFDNYSDLRKALYGGICYCPYPEVIFDHPMLCLDIKSAYIYALLVCMHAVSKAKIVDTETYERYLDSPYETSLGLYSIHYSCASNIISCYNLEKGEHTVDIWLNSVDLKNLLDLKYVHVHEIKCYYLEEYTLGSIPKYVKDVLVTEYIKKSEIDEEENPILYHLQKVVLNGVYGNTIKKVENSEGYKLLLKTNALAPQWGIWTTSYVKSMIIELGTELTGWYYTDTDSIYCLDTPENRAFIKAYNYLVERKVYAFCNKEGYDFNKLKELGKFELKYEIKKFKALKQKEYVFTTTSDKVIVKAAGCNKEEMPLDDSVYSMTKLPVGTRVFSKTNPNTTTCTKDGKTYTSHGSYYEKTCKGRDAEIELMKIAVMNEV